jgi:hypothetical protein
MAKRIQHCKVQFHLACLQYGISVQQGKDWMEKVRLMVRDDQNSLLDGAQDLSGPPTQPCEGAEMVTSVSG